MNGVRVSRELADNNVVYELECAARVLRECFAGIFGKFLKLIAVVLNANIIGSIKIQKSLQKGVGIDFLGYTVGQSRGNAVEFIVCQNQRAVINNVTRRVECNRYGSRGSIQNYGEKAQRRANSKFTVGKAALHKGVTDIKIVLTLVSHITRTFTNEVYKILVSLASGIGAGQVLIGSLGNDHRLGCGEDDVKRIVAAVCIKEVNSILCRKLGQKEHTVGFIDVNELFGKLAQRFFNVT